MKIQNISKVKVNKKVRLNATLVLDNGKKHEVYFEVDQEYGDFISSDASM